MSRWLNGLNQVSTLLEKLDDKVENVVEERAINTDDDDDDDVGDSHGAMIDDILSKRGLAADSKDEVDEMHGMDDGEDSEVQPATSSGVKSDNAGGDVQMPQRGLSRAPFAGTGRPVEPDDGHPDSTSMLPSTEEHPETSLSAQTSPNENSEKRPDIGSGTVNDTASEKMIQSVSRHGNPSRSNKEIELSVASKEAQKEVRVLRRHVVKLNENLEQAENEIAALRDELGRAAERMEKDRGRAKEQKEVAQKIHIDELDVQRKQHEQALKDQKIRFEGQLQSYKSKLSEMENQRKQEGGDWNKEIAQAFQREQEMSNRAAFLEDEKTVLLNQISTLQSQQAALGSRVESLTQASENAMAREREAEDRLDATLSQHARQISQRQAREADLERTIHELNSALATMADKQGTSNPPSDCSKSVGGVSLEARVELLESDLSAATSQLAHEKERNKVLHQQLVEMSKETTKEASVAQVKLLEYQRQVAEMELTISRLGVNLRDAQKEGPNDGIDNPDASEDEMKQQVRLLSEEVVRLRDKLGNNSGELLALKSRLHAALQRASKAEEELATATGRVGNDVYDSLERATGNRGPLRRQAGGSHSSTIRSVMRLNPGQGDRTEQIGKVVDAVDSFTVVTGKYLRRNPMARAGFIVYLLLIHLWTFVLLFFHAHNFESIQGDYNYVSVGPNALLEQHKQIADRAVAKIKSGSN